MSGFFLYLMRVAPIKTVLVTLCLLINIGIMLVTLFNPEATQIFWVAFCSSFLLSLHFVIHWSHYTKDD